MTEVNITFYFSLYHRPLKVLFLQNTPTNPADIEPYPTFLNAQILTAWKMHNSIMVKIFSSFPKVKQLLF